MGHSSKKGNQTMSTDEKSSQSYFTKTNIKATIRLKCGCGKWNNIQAQKVMNHVDNDEPKMEVFMPAYLPLETQVCAKCKTVVAEPKELIRITKDSPEI
jgi:hypothetical protein